MGGMTDTLRRIATNNNIPIGGFVGKEYKKSFGGLSAVGPFNPLGSAGIFPTKMVNKAISEGDVISGYKPPPETPTVTPVTPMPIPGQDDLANIAARRQSIEQQLLRRGRLSTILTSPQTNEPLGG